MIPACFSVRLAVRVLMTLCISYLLGLSDLHSRIQRNTEHPYHQNSLFISSNSEVRARCARFLPMFCSMRVLLCRADVYEVRFHLEALTAMQKQAVFRQAGVVSILV